MFSSTGGRTSPGCPTPRHVSSPFQPSMGWLFMVKSYPETSPLFPWRSWDFPVIFPWKAIQLRNWLWLWFKFIYRNDNDYDYGLYMFISISDDDNDTIVICVTIIILSGWWFEPLWQTLPINWDNDWDNDWDYGLYLS